MPIPDAQIHPEATGAAAKTVAAHKDKNNAALTFYSGWFCPYVQRVWLALEEKGIPYYYEEINPYHKDEYLKINPKGLVPAIRSDGVNIYESHILNEFLEDKFPQSKRLLPERAEQKAVARIQMDLVTKKIIPAYFRCVQSQDVEGQKAARKEMYDACREFGTFIDSSKGPFVGGKELDGVDIALAPWAVRQWVLDEHRGGPATEAECGQAYVKWAKAVQSHPTVLKTTSDREHYVPIYQRYLKDEAQSEAAKATRAGKVIP
ncbi:glutathione-S-transferase [Microstroma glucosiphilum]|uniref:Glutathione-S-transferase n=1 Tax=Pseudomicrostroma glucosiphilum TaxID=1684307 RepID=A0A316U2W9_9BASI|nr:glutathione-S-transferase [Pseudomicrostroma glucosiphilum]PWN19154.1 glutathione-S-transferase [Pseudomicrostroma glucosiphilum]